MTIDERTEKMAEDWLRTNGNRGKGNLYEAHKAGARAMRELIKGELVEVMSTEPLIHSPREDVLPDDHKLQHKDVFCRECGSMVHSRTNECMQTWVEIEYDWSFCIKCFAKMESE